MNAKKPIAYETECPLCLSLIRFESHEIQKDIHGDDLWMIICPVCRYKIDVKDGKSELHGYKIFFKKCVRPIYNEKEGQE